MKRSIGTTLLLVGFAATAPAQQPATPGPPMLPTPAEAQGWFAPTTPDQARDFLAALREAHPGVTVDTLALIPGDPVTPDSVLPVHLVTVGPAGPSDRDPGQTPAPERVRVLVLAAQRGDDFAGFEVSLRMMRDLAEGVLPGLLDGMEVAFVPAANPWGLLWWVREEPSGIDPARDHSTLRSRAMRAVHDFATAWRPQLVVELRDLGPAVYRIQAGLPVHPNVDPALSQYGRFYLMPYVANELAKVSITFREEVAAVPEVDDREPLIRGAESLPPGGFFTPGPLGADRARNHFALAGSLGLMLGVAALDGPEGLGSRTEMQYLALKALLEVTAHRSEGLRERSAAASNPPGLSGSDGEEQSSGALALRSRFETDSRNAKLTWLVWSQHGTVMRQTTEHWRSVVRRELALPLPAAWVIERDATAWVDLARAHGFVVERLSRPARVEVGAYPVGLPDRLPDDLAADLEIDEAPDASTLLVRSEREFAAGAWVVRSAQPRARLLFTLLEPWSQDAPLSAGRAEPVGDDGATPIEESFTYPLYRIDADELLRLRTEIPDEDGSNRHGRD